MSENCEQHLRNNINTEPILIVMQQWSDDFYQI